MEATLKLDEQVKKIGKAVEESKPYWEARRVARQVQTLPEIWRFLKYLLQTSKPDVLSQLLNTFSKPRNCLCLAEVGKSQNPQLFSYMKYESKSISLHYITGI